MASYKEALQVAKEQELSAYDFSPHYDLVFIIHEEGTTLTYRSAFIKEWQDWIMVFTEHHGYFVYHKTDLEFYAHYKRKEVEKLKTGHTEKCEFCGKDFNCSDLNYASHPDCNVLDSKLFVFCKDCKDIESSEYKELWKYLNEKGTADGPWGFTWGRDDMEHIKKAAATVMRESYVETWLDTVSEAFPKTARKKFEEGYYDDLYLAIYRCGAGDPF